jgi:hypothetical protein
MNTKQFLILGASVLASSLGGLARAEERQGREELESLRKASYATAR